MPSNSSLHLITKLINFEGVKATDYHFITDKEILITLSNQTSQSTCPHCYTITNKVHQDHYYRIRDIPMSSYHVFLNVNRRQFRCINCHKVFSEECGKTEIRRSQKSNSKINRNV
ncbi:transposase family protein [Geminocystis sp. GBBB08]|uniref:transposase family protein n=1 Tax=Geminocystis sp. GBBB08 TaxID=2604140 RepID=UPI0027E3A477|nr:transposase family protein [Geminocystis sp. GBBB08]